MVKLRLKRMGKIDTPFYRIVVLDSRKKRDGAYLESLGYYDPKTDPLTLKVDTDRAIHWLENGAQPSDTVRSLLRKAGILEKWHNLKNEITEGEEKKPKKTTAKKAAPKKTVKKETKPVEEKPEEIKEEKKAKPAVKKEAEKTEAKTEKKETKPAAKKTEEKAEPKKVKKEAKPTEEKPVEKAEKVEAETAEKKVEEKPAEEVAVKAEKEEAPKEKDTEEK